MKNQAYGVLKRLTVVTGYAVVALCLATGSMTDLSHWRWTDILVFCVAGICGGSAFGLIFIAITYLLKSRNKIVPPLTWKSMTRDERRKSLYSWAFLVFFATVYALTFWKIHALMSVLCLPLSIVAAQAVVDALDSKIARHRIAAPQEGQEHVTPS